MSLNVTCFQSRAWSHHLPVHFLDHIWCLVCYFLSSSAVSSGYLKSVFFILLPFCYLCGSRSIEDHPMTPQPVIYVQSYSNLLSSHKQDHAEHLLAGWSQGVCCLMREGSLCILSESQVRDEHSSAVVSSCLICLLSRVLDNKTVIAGRLALIRSRGFCKGCAAEPSTDLNPTRRCGCFISTLSNGRLPDSLLALMTAAVPRPRCRNAMMFM